MWLLRTFPSPPPSPRDLQRCLKVRPVGSACARHRAPPRYTKCACGRTLTDHRSLSKQGRTYMQVRPILKFSLRLAPLTSVRKSRASHAGRRRLLALILALIYAENPAGAAAVALGPNVSLGCRRAPGGDGGALRPRRAKTGVGIYGINEVIHLIQGCHCALLQKLCKMPKSQTLNP